jgi:hypothetical protein
LIALTLSWPLLLLLLLLLTLFKLFPAPLYVSTLPLIKQIILMMLLKNNIKKRFEIEALIIVIFSRARCLSRCLYRSLFGSYPLQAFYRPINQSA